VNAFPDQDGSAREIRLAVKQGGKLYTHASLAIASRHHKYDPAKLVGFASKGRTLINFPGAYQNFRVIPFQYLLSIHDEDWARPIIESLKDKAILVGHTAAGTAMDLKPTPFSPQYPGVGVQASMLHTLLSDKIIERLPRLFHFVLFFFFSFLIVGSASRASPLRGLSYTLASLALFFLISQLLFQYAHLWIPTFGFLILGVVLYFVVTLIQFVKIRVEREVFARELDLASKIQQNFLPNEIPKIAGLDIAAVSVPAKHVGGDLFDILPLQDDHWGICVGDVSGKGVPAALFMAKSISDFRREVESRIPAKVISHLNNRLVHDGTSGLFLTLLYLLLDPRHKKVSFANGGHEPIFLYQKKKNTVAELNTREGLPLGIMADSLFDELEFSIDSGDVILLQSDGVKEAMNPRREIFGQDRTKAAMMEAASDSSQMIVKHVQKRIQEFVKTAPQHDDLTLVCIKVQ